MNADRVPAGPGPFAKGPVLVATNLSAACDEAVRQADALARALRAPLVACHVLPEVLQVRMLFPHLRERDGAGVARLEIDAAGVVRRRVVELTGRPPGECRVIIEHGSPHSGIIRQAETAGAAVTVVGPGRVAERVVRTVCCATLIARPSPPGGVLAATDFSDPALPAVAAGAFEAGRRGVGLSVLHSLDLAPLAMAAPMAGFALPVDLSPEEKDELRAATSIRLRECLEHVAAPGAPIVAEGPASPAIVQAARDLPAELIVIGTHGRTGIARLALGSVAEEVVRSASCSTLVVRLHAA
jgi:universal stress protein E